MKRHVFINERLVNQKVWNNDIRHFNYTINPSI